MWTVLINITFPLAITGLGFFPDDKTPEGKPFNRGRCPEKW
jgi:hypothetical protein